MRIISAGFVVPLLLLLLARGGFALGAAESWDERMAMAGREFRTGRYSESEAILRELLAESASFADSQQRQVRRAEALNNLAEVDLARGRHHSAVTHFLEALEIRRQLLGPTANDVAVSLVGLSDAYMASGRQAEALHLLAQALVIASHVDNVTIRGGQIQNERRFLSNFLRDPSVVPGSPELAAVMASLGNYYQTQGQYDIAEKLFRKIVDIYDVPAHQDVSRLYRKPWDGGIDVGEGLMGLAEIYYARGLSSQADDLSRRAIEARRKEFGPASAKVAASMRKLAAIYRKQGRMTEADELERSLSEIRSGAR